MDERSLMLKEEIFGPVASIIVVDSIEDAIAFVNAREKPLAMTCFTSSNAVIEKVQLETSSGSITFNDHSFMGCINHPDLPFGGVGESGMGAYHSKWGFDEFSHSKSVMVRSTSVLVRCVQWIALPPMSDRRANLILSLLKYKAPMPKWVKIALCSVVIGGAATYYPRLIAGGWKLVSSTIGSAHFQQSL